MPQTQEFISIKHLVLASISASLLPVTVDPEGRAVNWVCSSYLIDVETESRGDEFLVSGLKVRCK